MRSAWAITFAVVTPTRSPVNSPGPIPTAIAARWSSATPSSSHRYWIAGASCSAWRRARTALGPGRELQLAEHAAAVTDRDATRAGRGVDREDEHVTPPRRPPRARQRAPIHDEPLGVERDDPRVGAVVVAVGEVEQDLEAVGGSSAPTRSPHSTTVTARRRGVVEPEVVQLLQVVEPVHVDVHEREGSVALDVVAAALLAHDGEGRAHDGSVTPSARAIPLANTVLPAPSSPASTTTSPARSSAPDALPRARASRRAVCRDRHRARSRGRARSARLIVTKSARACASAAPPLRSTADGCNAGISTVPSPNGNSLPAQLGDAVLGLEQQLGGEVAERHHDGGSMYASWPRGTGGRSRSRAGAGRGCPAGGTSRRWRCRPARGSSPMPSIRLVSSWPARPDERLAAGGPPARPGPRPRTSGRRAGRRRRTPPGCGSPPAGTCVHASADAFELLERRGATGSRAVTPWRRC